MSYLLVIWKVPCFYKPYLSWERTCFFNLFSYLQLDIKLHASQWFLAWKLPRKDCMDAKQSWLEKMHGCKSMNWCNDWPVIWWVWQGCHAFIFVFSSLFHCALVALGSGSCSLKWNFWSCKHLVVKANGDKVTLDRVSMTSIHE